MSFRIDPGAPLDAEIRRIATEQIDKASAELSAPNEGEDPHEAIHDVRKRMKRLRALVRLARPGDAAFAKVENARLRDAASALSAVRDRAALIESLDALAEHVPPSLSEAAVRAAFGPVRKALVAKRDAALAAEGDLSATIAATLETLAASRAAVDTLAFRRPFKDAAEIVADGYAATHARARSALKRATKSGEPEDLHELRKHVKYLGFHLGLLGPLWPEAFAPLRDAASAIADDLGRDHDYAVFRAELAAEPESVAARHADLVLALMIARQAELQATSLAAARRLLAETPKAAKARIRRLFDDAAKAAREAVAPPAGELAHAAE